MSWSWPQATTSVRLVSVQASGAPQPGSSGGVAARNAADRADRAARGQGACGPAAEAGCAARELRGLVCLSYSPGGSCPRTLARVQLWRLRRSVGAAQGREDAQGAALDAARGEGGFGGLPEGGRSHRGRSAGDGGGRRGAGCFRGGCRGKTAATQLWVLLLHVGSKLRPGKRGVRENQAARAAGGGIL